MKPVLFAVCFVLTTLSSIAQNADTTSVAKSKTNFIIGSTFNSGMNYYGRTDSLKSKGIYPFVGVLFKNGLYLTSTFVFISNPVSTRYAASIIESGYQFKNEKGNWVGALSGNYFIYQDNTSLPQSALKGMAGLTVSNLNKIININFGGNIKMSDNLDFGASAGIDHSFRIEPIGKGVIVIDPSAYLYSGTQRFTASYYKQKNFLFFPAGQQEVTTNSNRYNILSYEFSSPFIYAIGKLNLIVTPAYIIPQNLDSVPNRPDLSESGKALFYTTATIKFTL
jgi:hypothetical protein